MATPTATKTARKGRATSAGTRKPASTGKVATKTARTRTEPVKKAATVKKAAAAERMAMKTVPAKKTVTGKPAATATRKTAPMAKPASTAKPARGTGASLAVRRTGASAPAMRWTETLRDGTHVLIRPITRADAALERAFISRLSPQSRRLRFLGQIGEPGDALVRSLVDIDWRRDAAFIALVHHEGAKREVGVSRYSLSPDGRSCECAVTVDDEWHGRGLAVVLMRHLVELARSRGIGTMFSIDSAGNQRMRDLARYLGFACKPDPDEPGQVIHTLELAAK